MKTLIKYPPVNQLTLYRGIEKEGLRIDANGRPATTPHPAALGSALKNPLITTDFAESLPEIITDVHDNIDSLLEELTNLNAFLMQNMPTDETIWPASMPPQIINTDDIVIAKYGNSHLGHLKHLYRVGLSHRYGRVMQAIAGIHYNVSFDSDLLAALAQNDTLEFSQPSDMKSHYYMHLIRQFLQTEWLLILLFGASPVAMQSSIHTNHLDHIKQHNQVTFYGPDSTSLRLSPLGYQNSELSHICMHYDSVHQYAEDLFHYTQAKSKNFAHIAALFDKNARQLNKNILQIENEYYSNIRPKPKYQPGEKPSISLFQHGVEYIEIRIFDLNPFEPLGIARQQITFTDVLLTHCLINKKTMCTPQQAKRNTANVIAHGCNFKTQIQHDSNNHDVHSAANQLLQELQTTAHWMDNLSDDNTHEQAVLAQLEKIQSRDQLINTKMLSRLDDYQDHMLELAIQHNDHFRSMVIPSATLAHFQETAHQANVEQAKQETLDANTSFRDFYESYQSQPSLLHERLQKEKKK